MAHFYIDSDIRDVHVGTHVKLTGTEAHHAATVSRLRVGENILIGNGHGLVAQAHVLGISKSIVDLEIDSWTQSLQPVQNMTLVQALAKGDRDERAIEAATELGVDRIVPWAAHRSISKWEGPKIDKGVARWRSIVFEATKQSIRPFVPDVSELKNTSQIIDDFSEDFVVVLDPTGSQGLSELPVPANQGVVLIVGPEGGISVRELHAFSDAGCVIASLGQNILRTSTAGPAALAVLGAKLGRF